MKYIKYDDKDSSFPQSCVGLYYYPLAEIESIILM